jgi:xanthine dehydrogenase YagS FAD-binding subunit
MMAFTLERARNEREALAHAQGGGRYIAGGTTLVDLMREEVERPEKLIDINAVPLDYLREEEGDLIIGALARMSDVAAHPLTRRLQPLLAETLIEGASPQLRNMASIGGNLLQRVRCPYFRMLDAPCNKRVPGTGCAAIDGAHAGHAILGGSAFCFATHPSDLAVSLVALQATLRVLGPNGEREFPVEDLFRLPGDTPHLEHTLLPGELIVEVRVPGGPHTRRARYLKVRDRASYEFALVSAAAALDIVDGVIRDARIACGGVGTRPWRMQASEQVLMGKAPDRAAFDEAGRAALAGVHPLRDNHYKVPLLARTITRALEMASEVQP